MIPKVIAFTQVGVKVAALCDDTDLLTVFSSWDTVPAFYQVSLLDLALALLAATASLSRAWNTFFAGQFCVSLLKQGARERQKLGLSSQPCEAETDWVFSTELLAGFGRGQMEGKVIDSILLPGDSSLRVKRVWKMWVDLLRLNKRAMCRQGWGQMLGGVGAAGGEASLSLGLVSSKYGHTDTDNKRQHTGGWGRITESALIVAA